MHETDDAPAEEQSDEHMDEHTNEVRPAADSRLRTFRIGADRPFLVLPDEHRDDPPRARDGDADT